MDFPYVYELDGNKLYCNAHPPGRKDIVCGGELDYDDGFNNLICTKCGRQYHARDLKKAEKDQLIIVGGKKKMKVKIMRGNEVIHDSSTKQVAKVIEPPVIREERSKMVVKAPRDAIFNKIAEEVDNFADAVDEIVKDTRIAAPIVDDLVYRGNDGDNEPKELGTAKEENVSTAPLHFEIEQIKKAIEEYPEEEEETSEDSNEEESETNQDVEEESEDYDDDSYNDYDDEDDEEEMNYDKYLSNRERKQNRQIEKQNRRTDYDGF